MLQIKVWGIVAAGMVIFVAGCGQKQRSAQTAAPSQPPAATVPAQPMAPPRTDLSCTNPVMKDTSVSALKAAFGVDARLGDIPGAEGQTAKGAILYGATPSRTLDITYWDTAMAHLSGVSLGDKATAWTGPMGLHLGSTLAEVEAANGRSFSIAGFGWDYGGYALDFKGGALGRIAGGCTLSLRFDAGDSEKPMPDGISGDGVTVMSNDPRVRAWAPVLSQMEIGWPLPPGVTPAP